MKIFFGLSLPAFHFSSEADCIAKKRIIFFFGMLFMLAAASNISAAPFEIEGYIKQVRTIETKPPYTFSGKQVISIYIVGHRFGKDFDYQFMVVKDSTQLEGISFSDLETGKYVRVKSRAEPPGMVGKPIKEIRASRYGCSNYALHKILISHDSGWYNPGQENGGNFHGFTDIFDYLIPALKENGFCQDDIDLMLVKNPQKAYAVRLRIKKM